MERPRTHINTLAESKKVSIMIGKRMEAAVVTKQEIDEAREAYRTVATRGSIIYFVIADMARTRRPAAPSRRRRASSPGEHDFEAVRTASMLRA